MGPDESPEPVAQHSHMSTVQVLQAVIATSDISGTSSFEPALKHSTEQVVLFLHPPYCISQ